MADLIDRRATRFGELIVVEGGRIAIAFNARLVDNPRGKQN